jgi:hypothetical protein
MPSATPDVPLPPQAPRKFTSWCAGVFIFVMFMLAFADVEKINDLIIVMKLCYKYGATFLTWFVWIAWNMVAGIAYVINISSWQLIIFIGIFVVFLSYMIYQFCSKCMLTVRAFLLMLSDLFFTSIRTLAMALIASIVVAFGIYFFP